jgi:tetratricopeptide (TPR) repeat protein
MHTHVRIIIYLTLSIVMSLGATFASPSKYKWTPIIRDRLFDNNGLPTTDGSYDVILRLYDDSLAGKLLFQSEKLLTTENGWFTMTLSLPASLCASGPVLDSSLIFPDSLNTILPPPCASFLWLGMQIGHQAEIKPRHSVRTCMLQQLHAMDSAALNVKSMKIDLKLPVLPTAAEATKHVRDGDDRITEIIEKPKQGTSPSGEKQIENQYVRRLPFESHDSVTALLPESDHVSRGKRFFAIGEYQRAVHEYGETLKKTPANADIYLRRGMALYSDAEQNGVINYVDNERWFTAICDQMMVDYISTRKIDPNYADLCCNPGHIYSSGLNSRLIDTAIFDFTKALAIDPSSAEIYLERAKAFQMAGKYKNAIKDYDEFIELNGLRADVLCEKSIIALLNNDDSTAISDNTRALALDSENSGAYFDRARAYYLTGNYPLGLSDCTKALKLEPGNVGALYYKALLCEKLGDTTQAINSYNSFIMLAPSRNSSLIAHAGVRIKQLKGE